MPPSSLPLELWLLILDLLPLEFHSDYGIDAIRENRHNVLSLSRTCKYISSVCRPRLFSHLRFRSIERQIAQLVKDMLADGDLTHARFRRQSRALLEDVKRRMVFLTSAAIAGEVKHLTFQPFDTTTSLYDPVTHPAFAKFWEELCEVVVGAIPAFEIIPEVELQNVYFSGVCIERWTSLERAIPRLKLTEVAFSEQDLWRGEIPVERLAFGYDVFAIEAGDQLGAFLRSGKLDELSIEPLNCDALSRSARKNPIGMARIRFLQFGELERWRPNRPIERSAIPTLLANVFPACSGLAELVVHIAPAKDVRTAAGSLEAHHLPNLRRLTCNAEMMLCLAKLRTVSDLFLFDDAVEAADLAKCSDLLRGVYTFVLKTCRYRRTGVNPAFAVALKKYCHSLRHLHLDLNCDDDDLLVRRRILKHHLRHVLMSKL
jgi:hypothetical protein